MRLVFTADPGPAVVVALSDMRDRFRLVAAEVDLVPLPQPCPICRSVTRCGGRSPTSARQQQRGSPPAPRTTLH